MQKNKVSELLSKLEKIEWVFFFTANGNQLALDWQREFKYYNYNGDIKSFHVDFYYEDETGAIKVAIECDDSSHKNRQVEDKLRDDTLKMQGIKVFRFNTKDITWNCLKCVNEVKAYIFSQKEILQRASFTRKFNETDGGQIKIRIS